MTKILFIEAIKKNLAFNPKVFDNLPAKLHILYSIQYKPLAEAIAHYLKDRVLALEQVLGCSRINPKASLLLIGSGRFHGLNLAISSGKPVYIYNNGKIDKISESEIKDYEKKEAGKFAKFLLSDNIGILFSTKPGQNKKVDITKLESKYPEKKFYLFLADNINLAELENFKIDFWINTACPGLALDSPRIINYEKIK